MSNSKHQSQWQRGKYRLNTNIIDSFTTLRYLHVLQLNIFTLPQNTTVRLCYSTP